jgi:hypothetical protein
MEAQMKKVEVELVGDVINAAVVKLPGRRFPGVVIQGDSLGNLNAITKRLVAALSDGRVEDARDEATEIQELLSGYKHVYEDAMNQAGLALPY